MEDRCVCCGAIIPEGQMVCPNCLVYVNAVTKSNEKIVLIGGQRGGGKIYFLETMVKILWMKLQEVEQERDRWKSAALFYANKASEKPEGETVTIPCRIGQKVYTIPRSAIREWTVCGVWVSVDANASYAHIYWEKNGHRVGSRAVSFKDLGNTVYLTRKDAEEALAKIIGGGEDGN